MEQEYRILPFAHSMMEECVALFIDTFSREPWNDVFELKQQVISFFENHRNNNYFVGYVLKSGETIVATSIGMKKPWINGMEYYIDEFCVKADWQGRGVGSEFLRLIEADIKTNGMNAIILNTNKGFPSEKFYLNNGFHPLAEIVLLAK